MIGDTFRKYVFNFTCPAFAAASPKLASHIQMVQLVNDLAAFGVTECWDERSCFTFQCLCKTKPIHAVDDFSVAARSTRPEIIECLGAIEITADDNGEFQCARRVAE